MSLTSNFLSAILASTIAFTNGLSGISVAPQSSQSQTVLRNNVDAASGVASTSSMTSGIVVIDRATGNSMETNGDNAHRPFALETLGRLPILFYAVRTDPKVAKGKVPDIISMMEGVSGEATQRAWDKYGKTSIISDTAKKYGLQETKTGKDWKDSTSTAVDVGRMIRRFLDDKQVSVAQKKWVLGLLSKTTLSVSGEDFSWGLPSAAGLSDSDSSNTDRDSGSGKSSSEGNLWWSQGWAPSGHDPMVRHSAGVYGDGFRFITVVMGQFPKSTDNSEANRISSQVSTALIQGGQGESSHKLEDYGEGTKTVETFIEYMDGIYKNKKK